MRAMDTRCICSKGGRAVSRASKLLGALVGAGACAWLAWYLVVGTPVRFGAVAVASESGGWRLLYGYAMTIAGVVLGSAYRYLEGLRSAGVREVPGVRALTGAVFRSVEFWLGMCGSPLVYALLLRATDGGSNAGLTAIAIENGFFCTLIVERLAAGGRGARGGAGRRNGGATATPASGVNRARRVRRGARLE